LARRDPDPNERASWVQTNTEFHRDWTEQQNQGHQVKWKSGLSLEPTNEERRRHRAQVAPRRPRRFLFWLVIAGMAFGSVYLFFRGL
jgi:hypothetical protein